MMSRSEMSISHGHYPHSFLFFYKKPSLQGGFATSFSISMLSCPCLQNCSPTTIYHCFQWWANGLPEVKCQGELYFKDDDQSGYAAYDDVTN